MVLRLSLILVVAATLGACAASIRPVAPPDRPATKEAAPESDAMLVAPATERADDRPAAVSDASPVDEPVPTEVAAGEPDDRPTADYGVSATDEPVRTEVAAGEPDDRPAADYGISATDVPVRTEVAAGEPDEDESLALDKADESGVSVTRDRTVVDFGDDIIDGEIARPEGTLLESRKATKQKSLIEVPEHLGPPAGLDPGLGREHEKSRVEESARHSVHVTLAERQALARMGRVGEELWVVVKPPAPPAAQAKEAPGSGELRAAVDGTLVPLPLKHTDVLAKVHGYIASVKVTQQYENPFRDKIEATYVFPLPQNAAVSEFVMVIGERRIRGIIRERKEAERIYREARAMGLRAGLLTQERPNVFTQKVANIEPGKRIDVELTYYGALPYRDGAYELVFPMVVGPRFNSPTSSEGVGAVPRGSQAGSSGQPVEVSYLKPGEESSHDVSLRVMLDAGVKIEKVKSLHHEIRTAPVGPTASEITLAKQRVIPNRDFVLRYWVAGKRVKSAFLAHEDARGGTFTLMLQPPAKLASIPRSPREMVFVLDCSGSMSGWPLAKAKRAIRRVLDLMDEDDTFQIIRFSDNASSLGPQPVAATRRNVRRGLHYLESLDSEGGTMMIEGIKAALDFPHEQGKVRLVSFLTDGFIGNETEILAAIHERLGESRLFSFGIGSSPNRYLLERMASMGRGAVAWVSKNDAASDAAVDAFFERIAYPALSDIEIDWGSLRVTDVYPSAIPDLHVGRPVIVTGRYQGTPQGRVRVTGRAGGKRLSYEVSLSNDGSRSRPALPRIWARMRMADLATRATYEPEVAPLAAAIRETALSYGIMSRYTAFVAVDSSYQTVGEGKTVPVAVPVPEDVKYETTVGER